LPGDSPNFYAEPRIYRRSRSKLEQLAFGRVRAFSSIGIKEEAVNLHVDHIGDLAVVECQGRIFPDDEAFNLRDAVLSQAEASAILLDLSQVYAMGDNVLWMLVRLHRWAVEHHVDLRLFNPTSFVFQTFEEAGFSREFHIDNNLEQIFALMARARHEPYLHAA
jgi:anti-anti-sigma regulatory factor